MTTYQMTEQDKAVSHRELRRQLYFRWSLIPSLDASDQACAAALRAIPNIDNIVTLQNTVGNDAVWAARQVLDSEV